MPGNRHKPYGNRILTLIITKPFRILATLVVLALPAVPVILLIQNDFDSRGFLPLPSSAANLALPKDDYYGVPTEVYNASKPGAPSDLCVTFEFLSINPSVPDVTIGVLVGATAQGDNGKHDLASMLGTSYKDVSLVVKSNSGLSNFKVPIAESALKAAPPSSCGARPLQNILDQNAGYRATWTLSLLGQPRAFPQDWYELDDSVAVVAGQSQNGTELPSSLVMMSRDEDLRVRVQVDHASLKNEPGEHQLFFTVHHPPWVITYTYWVGAMPFVLLVVLLWFKRIAKKEALEASGVAFGVAATMVAILPLRTVLVPSTVPGLTRLDLFFGLGISFLVGSSILWVVVWLPQLTHPASRGADCCCHAHECCHPHDPGNSSD